MEFSESTRQIQNDGKFFEVKVFEAEQPKRIVAFAAGRGGSPDRHLALLRTIASCGCTVVAPYFDMLNALTPAKVELEARIERLEISLKMYSHFDQPMAGIGHSIGATLLLTLAGGKAITFSGDHLGAK